MLEHILDIQPATDDEQPEPRTSRGEKWALHLVAARQFYEREKHLRVPRKHVETITVSGRGDGEDQQQRGVQLRPGRGSATTTRGPRR